MHALLLVCAVVVGAETRTINNARSLVENEWSNSHYFSGQFTSGAPGYRMLSLREGEQWHSGTVWLFNLRESQAGEFSADAYRGVYRIHLGKEDDLLVLLVGFTRKYSAHGRSRGGEAIANWSLIPGFLPEGAEFALPLDPNNTVPSKKIVLSFERAFYVDEDGRETVRRSSPGTLMERVTGQGAVRTLRRPDFANMGETIELWKGDAFQCALSMKMPPTYRSRPQTEGAMKFSSTGTTGATPATTRVAAIPAVKPAPPTREQRIASTQKEAADAFSRGDYQRAVSLYSAVLELSPTMTSAWTFRALAHFELGNPTGALADLSEAIRRDPGDAHLYFKRGDAYVEVGRYREAVADYSEVVRRDPQSAEALDALAWLLATCADSSIRNGDEAFKLARRASGLTGYADASFVDTLAAACAEIGEFEMAVRLQRVVVERADESWKEGARERLRLYESGRPWRTY